MTGNNCQFCSATLINCCISESSPNMGISCMKAKAVLELPYRKRLGFEVADFILNKVKAPEEITRSVFSAKEQSENTSDRVTGWRH